MTDVGPQPRGKDMAYKTTPVPFVHRHRRQLTIYFCVAHFQGNSGSSCSSGLVGPLFLLLFKINGWYLGGLRLEKTSTKMNGSALIQW